jgi:hypothetical protein
MVWKVAKRFAETRNAKNIDIKSQFESRKHVHQTTFETIEYVNKLCYEPAYLGKNSFYSTGPVITVVNYDCKTFIVQAIGHISPCVVRYAPSWSLIYDLNTGQYYKTMILAKAILS